MDNIAQDGKAALVLEDGVYDMLPEYLLSNMSLIAETENYDIYIADESRFDLQGGPVKDKKAIRDFAYSPGYEIVGGKLDESGVYISGKGKGELLVAEYPAVEGSWDYELIYEYEEAGQTGSEASFLIYSDGEPVSETVLDKHSGSVHSGSVPLGSGGEVRTVLIGGGSSVRVKQIMIRETE